MPRRSRRSLRNFAPTQAGPDGTAIAADVPDVAAVIAGFPGGVLATFAIAGYGRPDPVNGVTLVGTGGVLRVDLPGSRLELAAAGADRLRGGGDPRRRALDLARGGRLHRRDPDGTPVRLTDFATGVRYMAFTDAVHEADRTGRRVVP